MRLKISLSLIQNPEKENIIPINYQSELSACISGILDSGDLSYKKWLGSLGFLMGSSYFKNYTFSPFELIDNMYVRTNDQLILKCTELEFSISFLTDPSAEEHLLNLFKNQNFTLGGKNGKTHFTIQSITKIDSVQIPESICLRTISPIVISKQKKISIPQSKQVPLEYLEADNNEFNLLLLQSLTRKYLAINKGKSIGSIANFKVEYLSPIKTKLVKIKDERGIERKIKGSLFEFKITTSASLIEVGLAAGFGDETQVGFGFCNIIENYTE